MKSAFTLLEVLITIVVLLVLAALALPGSARARQLASLSRCQSNQRQLGIAMAGYTSDNGAFPVAGGGRWLLAGLGGGNSSVVMCPRFPGASYVHNRWGSSLSHDPAHLGLGPRGEAGTAVSAVLSPAACILLFDPIPVLAPPNLRPGIGTAMGNSIADPAAVRLHGEVGVMGFVDGHVERVSVPIFARGDPRIRHGWNIDNQSHDENWP